MNRQFRFGIGIAVVLIAIAYFAFAGYNDSKAYYKTIEEVAAMGPEAQTKRLRVAGLVKEGTIVRDGTHVSFVLAQDVVTMKHSMRVHYVGSQPVPDTFKDRAEVVVKGTLTDGRFDAREISAKCPSKYQTRPDGPAATLCTRGDANVETAQAAQN